MGMFTDGWTDEIERRAWVDALFKKYMDSVEVNVDIVFTYDEECYLKVLREKPSKKNQDEIPF